ncbi:MAG: TIGR00282 family metallophosphoesterase [Patescibacteria group bacterium]|nr:TIGR00282 family metallophosphoesterase [Patescibacteria group bacterium]MDD5121086.1 TIGR00282 family metallophosphoesterase [Patescibacteria group bacterium]MDD5221984.1 TIGR00282 family metallophosphoesterase [Patescibacteria group bacterium]MDD5395995.1 TIGR00282 family metallophosphoesterase [Patescibacteria group bacterium]
MSNFYQPGSPDKTTTMKILFFGDVFGKMGRLALVKELPKIKKKWRPDLTLANVENMAHGKGVTIKTLRQLSEAGIDAFTSGDHFWSKKEELDKIKKLEIPIIRPDNFKGKLAGRGHLVIKCNKKNVLLVNLMGRTFSKYQDERGVSTLANPFKVADKILKKYPRVKIKIVDFHGEATSEKVSLGHYLNGRVSAILGTHTHIPTADEQTLSRGTAYITDVGMVGPKDSVIGVEKTVILDRFLHDIFTGPIKMEIPETGSAVINGVVVEIDDKTGQAKKISRINQETLI